MKAITPTKMAQPPAALALRVVVASASAACPSAAALAPNMTSRNSYNIGREGGREEVKEGRREGGKSAREMEEREREGRVVERGGERREGGREGG